MQEANAVAVQSEGISPWQIEFQQLVNESNLLDMRLNELAEALFAPTNQ